LLSSDYISHNDKAEGSANVEQFQNADFWEFFLILCIKPQTLGRGVY
jgi:hypothetical protein